MDDASKDRGKELDDRIRRLVEEARKCETCGREKNAHSRLRGWFCLSCNSKR